jgi:hypothetical protein
VKILFDHNVPRPLAHELGTHDGPPTACKQRPITEPRDPNPDSVRAF